MDWDLLSFVFEFVILRACTSLCAPAMVFPTTAAPYQDSPQWRRLSDVAAAAAVAAPGADGTVLGGPGVWPVGQLDGRGRAGGAKPVRPSR